MEKSLHRVDFTHKRVDAQKFLRFTQWRFYTENPCHSGPLFATWFRILTSDFAVRSSFRVKRRHRAAQQKICMSPHVCASNMYHLRKGLLRQQSKSHFATRLCTISARVLRAQTNFPFHHSFVCPTRTISAERSPSDTHDPRSGSRFAPGCHQKSKIWKNLGSRSCVGAQVQVDHLENLQFLDENKTPARVTTPV